MYGFPFLKNEEDSINNATGDWDFEVNLHIDSPGEIVNDREDGIDDPKEHGLDYVVEPIGVRYDQHIEEHEDGIGRVGHNIYSTQFVRLIEQDPPIDDGDDQGQDQRDIVEPPIHFKRSGHVHNVVGGI